MTNPATSVAHPTEGQLFALGLLAVYGEVWVNWTISREELRQLEAMGLCQADHKFDGLMTDTVKWTIAEDLTALLLPYIYLIENHRYSRDKLNEIEKRIHPYWGTTSCYHKPEGVNEQEQIELVRAADTLGGYLSLIRKEIGQGLARHWIMWLEGIGE